MSGGRCPLKRVHLNIQQAPTLQVGVPGSGNPGKLKYRLPEHPASRNTKREQRSAFPPFFPEAATRPLRANHTKLPYSPVLRFSGAEGSPWPPARGGPQRPRQAITHPPFTPSLQLGDIRSGTPGKLKYRLPNHPARRIPPGTREAPPRPPKKASSVSA